MADKTPVQIITDQIPADAICERFGVKDRSIRLARERGVFPASWYRGIKLLCAEHGVEFTDEAFNWKDDSEVSAVAS
jgi:hypothetical protein